MDSIKQHIRINKTKEEKTERGELMRFFLETINPYRRDAGFKQLNYPRMGKILQNIPTKDLYFMVSNMKDLGGEKAIKWFYWSLKNQDDESYA